MNAKQISKELVKVVIDKLYDRKGFDDWLDAIDDKEILAEIVAELEAAVAAKLTECATPCPDSPK